MFFPYIVSSQERCLVPTASFDPNGHGCFLYFPLWWISEERAIDGSHAIRLKRDYLDVPLNIFMAAIIGAAVGILLICVGIVPWYLAHKRGKVFRSRIYID